MTWILPFFDPYFHCDITCTKKLDTLINLYRHIYIYIHYTTIHLYAYQKKKTPFHDAIRLPLAAPNHDAIRFFGADTFEPGGAVCFNGRGGNPPPKPVVRWLKVVPMENHKVLTLSTSTISTDHKNVMSRSWFLDHNIPNMHPIFFNKFISNW